MMRERTHSSAPIVSSSTVRISDNMSNVEVLLEGTTRPETWIMKKVGTSISALTKKLKKPTERKLLLQALRAACRLFSEFELMVSILRRRKRQAV